jgi:hypothetical protein
MMMKHEALYRAELPETLKIQDRLFDNTMYVDWLEDKLAELLPKENKSLVQPIREVGGINTGTLYASYIEIVEKVGEPNVTDMDDAGRVKASWGFKDVQGRKGFIWCYKYYGPLNYCTEWSVDGDMDLLKELFGNTISRD